MSGVRKKPSRRSRSIAKGAKRSALIHLAPVLLQQVETAAKRSGRSFSGEIEFRLSFVGFLCAATAEALGIHE